MKQFGELDTDWLREFQIKFPEVTVVDLKGFIVGRDYVKLWDVFPFSEVVKAFDEAVRLGESSSTISEGERTFILKFSRVGSLITILKQDITLENEIKELKNSIVSTLFHEIKTPLAAIKGNAEFLLIYGECLERDAIKEIHEKAEKIEEILSGIEKLFSRRVSSFRWINLRPLTEEVLETFRVRAKEKGLSIFSKLQDVNLPADRVLFQQLLRNLIDNAVNFTNEGSITVELTPDCLRVSDTGMGIPSELLSKVFERFVRGEHSTGSGIGLSVVREISRFHGWRVSVESEEGKGTTFTVHFQKDNR